MQATPVMQITPCYGNLVMVHFTKTMWKEEVIPKCLLFIN